MDNLEKKRHSLAHLLAAATLRLFPDAKVATGPATETGFYYDIDFGDADFSDKSLSKIQKVMRKTLSTWTTFEPKTLSPDEAKELFKDNPYKLELVDDIIARGEEITVYTSGRFTDLCRGGHVENMKEEISADTFKLSRVAGAYWKSDESNKMLTRIVGLAFDTKEELDAHLLMREEAKKRDHRKLGKELDLFTFSELVGPGLPLFTPKGTLLRDLIVEKIHSLQSEFGYQKVTIPHITKKDLYITSGHWAKFGDELFKVKGKSDAEFVMKPMNCPHHTQIFASRMRSYRDLPIRYTEVGVVYRDEQAGELLGLSRVRAISQDDGHVFCRPDQIEQEIKNIVTVIKEFYSSLDMLNDGDYWVSLSARDPKQPEKYLGEVENWEIAENALEKIAKEEGLPYKKVEGEAAFYGPKLDFMFKDAIGREWQLGTAQLDFVMPARFSLEYTDQNGDKQTPVMIHRAIAGSLERFLSVVIEHFAGHFPLWLSPVQVTILPVSVEKHADHAYELMKELKKNGLRIEVDAQNESLGKRIRNARLQKVPYLIVIGDNELESKIYKLEGRNDEAHENLTVEDVVKTLQSKIK